MLKLPNKRFIKLMPLFETAIEIDHKAIAELVLKNWNLNLGKLLKASQNQTF